MNMKTHQRMAVILSAIAIVSIFAYRTSQASPLEVVKAAVEAAAPMEETMAAVSSDPEVAAADVAVIYTSTLSDDEIAGLQFVREEEKLARDVYLYFYQMWGNQVFQNIAQSEQSHMDAILTLLDGYGISDPAAYTQAGEFVDADLQALYDQLIAQGSQSLHDALLVGAAIEEIDIRDIAESTAQTTHSDLVLVYENLTAGSENHLKAFTNTLSNLYGETYVPQFLSSEEYQEIVNMADPGNPSQRGRKNS